VLTGFVVARRKSIFGIPTSTYLTEIFDPSQPMGKMHVKRWTLFRREATKFPNFCIAEASRVARTDYVEAV